VSKYQRLATDLIRGGVTVFQNAPCHPLRWLYSCMVRPVINCMLWATFGPVFLIKRWMWLDLTG